MKNFILSGGLASLIVLSACSGNDTPAYDNTLPSTNDTTVTAASVIQADSATAVLNNQAPAQVVSTNPVQVQSKAAPAPVVSSVASKGATGLNPAHGQPGHRCDIAVGAPLNSAPTATTSTPAPVVSQVTPVATPTQSRPSVISGAKPAVNPPHGEPGHDCAVQVGAPLPQ